MPARPKLKLIDQSTIDNVLTPKFSQIKVLFLVIPFLALISLAKPAIASATTYYVDCAVADNNGNGTSEATAFKNLSRFSEDSGAGTQLNLSAGDNLYLKRGCDFTGYKMDLDWNGADGNPITVGAYGTGDQPTVWLDYPETSTAIIISGSYITLQDLEITADQSALPHTYTACPDLAHGFFYGIRIDPPANNITIQNNTITQFARGINMTINSSDPGVTPHHVNILYNDISNNTAAADGLIPQETMNGGKAIDVKGNDNIIAYNYMANNSTPCTDNSGLYESNAVEIYAAKRNQIHHNVSVGNRVFSEMGGITNNLDFNTEDTVFAYNLVTTTQGSARFIVIHGENQTHGPTLNTKIYNNTYYAPTNDDAQAISCSGCGTNVLTMRNNIIWARNKVLFVGPSGTQINESNNIFWNGVSGANVQNWTIDATSSTVDPGFVDATNGNFRLESDSPAIDAGSNTESLALSYNTEDLDGISLPQNSTVDIGAYENAVAEVPSNGTTYASDTFTRTTSPGWGTTETGSQTWTTGATGSGSSNSVNGSQAIGVIGSCGGTTTARLDSLDQLNTDTLFKFKTDKATGSGDFNYYIINRKQAEANWEYRHRIQFNGTTVKLMAGKLLGTSTLVGISADTTVARESFAADTFFWVRTQTYGTSPTTIRMKIWEDGTSEPTAWDLTATDSETNLQESGAAGVRAFLPAGCTTAPLTTTYDDFSITSLSSPTISLTAQYQTDCSTAVTTGSFINGTSMCIGATVNDADNPDILTLEAEVQPTNTSFTNTANFTSSATASSGTEVTPTIDVTGLTTGTNYHWQARVVDSLGNASTWVSFGGNTETSTDFSMAAVPTIQFTSASASGAESTTAVTLPVSISNSASQNVTVNYAVTGGTASGSGTDFTLASGTATITPGNTSTTIPVTVVNDQIDEDDETIQVTLSSPTNASLGSNAVYTYTITDNDTAGRSLTPSTSINATEGGATASYTIRLNTQPTADVVVSLSADSQVSLSTSSLTFTSSDWNQNKQITATAVNDLIAEGNHDGIITHTATSADPKYDGLSFPTKTVKITDNDSAGVSINESSGSTVATEGGATDSYTIALSTQPSSDVTITVSPDADVSVDDTSLVFTNLNWSTPQTVTVTAVNDDSVEGEHTGTINHSAASSDGNYNSISIGSITTTITDNDTAGVTITESTGSTAVTEGGATDSYTVVLTSEPTNDVTITITDDSEISLDDNELVFTSENWDSAQTVTVTAVNDDFDEDSESSIITHSAASEDSNYSGISISNVSVTVTDNDTAGITLVESGGSTSITEGGATDTFTLVLDSEPTANVEIDISSLQATAYDQANPPSGEEEDLTPPIIFTSANWDTAITILVTAVDDDVAEGAHTGDISFNVSSSDGDYGALTINDVEASITDNDTASVTVTESGGTTTVVEGGATDSYTIVLGTEPSSDVTISLSTSSRLQLSSSTLTFTSTNWDTAQTVTVTATDDSNYLGNGSVNITHTASSSDGEYDGISVDTVSVDITEDETSGITVTESSGSTNVTEGGATDTYSLVLDAQPSNDVTVTVNGGVGQVTLSDTELVFTNLNWDTPQDITVTAVNDSIAENATTATLTHTSTSSDGAFNNLTIGSVTVNVTDNDTAGVTITQSSGSTAIAEETETSDSYTVVLNTQPTNDVTISISGATSIDIDKTTLTFTTGNWDTPQTVTVTAIDDSTATGTYSNVLAHSASSSDTFYDEISIANVTAVVTDNDTSGITVTESSGSTTVSESGTTDTFTIVLDSQPSSDVTIDMATSQATVVRQGTSSSTLTFTNSNWETAQTVVVTALNDQVAEGTQNRTINFSVSSSDLSYNEYDIPGVSFSITDNDTAGVTVTQTSGSTTVNEDGTTDTYTIVLNTQPTNTVIINATPDSGITVSPVSRSFTISNWSTPQTFTVSAIDNTNVDGNRTRDIDHSAVSSDTFYDEISISSITTTVEDNEVPGVTISQSGGSTSVNENAGTDSYTIALSTTPSDDVTINLATTSSEITLSEDEIVFTASDWNVPYTITVTGVDDALTQGNRSATITHTSTSDDDNFDELSISNIVVTIVDDEVEEDVEVQVEETEGNTVVDEDDEDTIEIELTDAPTSTVYVHINGDDDGEFVSLSEDVLEFTPDNWDGEREVDIEGKENDTVDGDQKIYIEYRVESEDNRYDGLELRRTEVYFKDNDIATALVNEEDIPEDGITPFLERETPDEVLPPIAIINMNIDLDSDGDFDQQDLDILRTNWQQNLAERRNGDLNNDGKVDLSDLSIFARNWGIQ